MEIRNIDSAETSIFLRSLIASGRNVPFIGTGFTAGERAQKKPVPNGQQWMSIMRQQIENSPEEKKPSSAKLGEYRFQELADIYFCEPIIPLQQIKTTLDAHFSNVDIKTPSKLAFLAISWPYLYTLNIDDGIERAINGVPIVPYESFARSNARRYVYKLHGDIVTAQKAKEKADLKLIFGKGDYVKSLRKNIHLIDALTTDLVENNVIFIGCSLTDELDILLALSDSDLSNKTNIGKRIYLTTTDPTKDYDVEKKLRDYGITDVIVGDFDRFYLMYVEIAKDLAVDVTDTQFSYQKKSQTYDMTRFLRYFIQSDWSGGDSSHLSIVRKQDSNLLQTVQSHPVCIVYGARFSGRTSALYKLLNTYTSKRKFFIGSETALHDSNLNELICIKDGLIVFDAESLTYAQIKYVCEKEELIRERNSNVVIALNKGDLNAAKRLDEKALIDFNDFFNNEEQSRLNARFDSIGVKKLDKGKILDNIYQIANSAVVNKKVGSESSLRKRLLARVEYTTKAGIDQSDFTLLYLLLVRQRIFSYLYRKIAHQGGYSQTVDDYIDTFVKNWSPFIDKIDTALASHKATHSSFELVSNSQAWLHFALASITKKLGVDRTADCIVNIVASIRDHDSDYYEVIMFDALNMVFSSSHSGLPSRIVISEIYRKLAPVLGSEPNYWLQRSKSIYHNHDGNTIEDVLIAIEHAEKAISETEANVTINAKLTRANLFGLLCKLDNYKTEEYLSDAIQKYAVLLEDYDRNSRYLDGLFEKNRYGEGYLRGVVRNASAGPRSIDFLRNKDSLDMLRLVLQQ